jgi:hypothetical protein
MSHGEEERLMRHMQGVSLKEGGHTKLHIPAADDAEKQPQRNDSKPPVGAVGIVSVDERAAQDERELAKHLHASEKRHHILTEALQER